MLAATLAACATVLCASPRAYALDALCGDANRDGQIKSSDAQLALRVAVESATCPLFFCDYNGDDKITATDALLILREAVGQTVVAKCPPAPTTPLLWDQGTWDQVLWD